MGQKIKKYKNCQNSPKQSWANNQIFKYICIFGQLYSFAKIFGNFFLDQIYSDIHSGTLYHVKYIGIFIRPISMVKNISGYSFVQKNDIHTTLVNTILQKEQELE